MTRPHGSAGWHRHRIGRSQRAYNDMIADLVADIEEAEQHGETARAAELNAVFLQLNIARMEPAAVHAAFESGKHA